MGKRNVQIGILLILAACFNPATILGSIHKLVGQSYFYPYSYHFWLLFTGLALWNAWALLTILAMLRRKVALGFLFGENAGYVSVCALCGLLFMLAVNPIYAGHFQWMRVALPIGNLFLIAKAFHLGFVQANAGSRAARFRAWATTVFSIIAVLLILESVFMFVSKSQNNDNALASKVWFGRYWQVNDRGFREQECAAQIGLLGDSFVAGHGIRQPADRFGDLLQQAMPNGPILYNMGLNGASTSDELDLLNASWPTLKSLVLVWYVNDIQDIARQMGLQTGNENSTMPWPISLRHGSYLFNFLDGLFPDPKAGENYLNFLHKAYADKQVTKAYFEICDKLQQHCRDHQIKLCVVLFPMMNAVDKSEFAVGPVRDYWSDRAPTLDLTSVYHPYPPEKLVVNGGDAHPNEFAQKLAADAILPFLKENHLLPE